MRRFLPLLAVCALLLLFPLMSQEPFLLRVLILAAIFAAI